MNLYTRSELREGGRHPEDGERIIVEVWQVVLESDQGDRWTHELNFPDQDEAERFKDTLGPILCDEHCNPIGNWHETWPCYGSPAYIRIEPEIVAMERREDEEGW
jgi:hypothetical protein